MTNNAKTMGIKTAQIKIKNAVYENPWVAIFHTPNQTEASIFSPSKSMLSNGYVNAKGMRINIEMAMIAQRFKLQPPLVYKTW
ncbi:hypothetical protein HMPREF9065_01657 [Aggregatibacter sp. oral taxon 458 str. W10330]|nr:hypothetical protein HMPREF9065_01657 [Aggregatibacter sp. oral taxon 458 str. W10330]